MLSSETNEASKRPSAKMVLTLVAVGLGFVLLVALNMN